ncbi:MAG: hypothetical protein KJ607_07575, partial [Bacteroidetes bacterium]|nr:hypothetical protein [Bacteroidota bacterium]
MADLSDCSPEASVIYHYDDRFPHCARKDENPDSFKYPGDWVRFICREGAFSVLLPVNPQYQQLEVENPEVEEGGACIIHLYKSYDSIHDATFLVRYNDFPAGYVALDDNDYFESLIHGISGEMQSLPDESAGAVINNCPCRKYLFDNTEGNDFMQVMICLRGNRTYLLMATMDRSVKDSCNYGNFFDSFRYEEFPVSDLVSFRDSRTGFSVLLPGLPVYEADTFVNDCYSELDYSLFYSSSDPASGIPYFLVCDVYPALYRISDAGSFLQSVSESFFEFADTLLTEKRITVQGYPGMDAYFSSDLVHTYLKTRFVLQGRCLYQLYAYVSPGDTACPSIKRIFNSLEFEEMNYDDISGSKATEILSLLHSESVSDRYNAARALNYYPFSEDELPLIYNAIHDVKYSDTSLCGDVENSLIEIMTWLHDQNTFDFIAEVYQNYNDRPEKQILLLKVLASMPGSEAFELLIGKLRSPPYAKDYEALSGIFVPFADSLELFAGYYPELIHLIDRAWYDSYIIELTNMMLDSGVVVTVQMEAFAKTYSQAFVRLAAGYGQMKESDEHYYNTVGTLLELMRIIDCFALDHGTAEVLSRFLHGRNDQVKISAALIIENHGRPVGKKTWKQLSGKDYYRFDVLKGLDGISRLDLAPEKYLSQESVAEADLLNLLFLSESRYKYKAEGERIIRYNGSDCRI